MLQGFFDYSLVTGKLATDELEEPIVIDDNPELTETTKLPQYSSIDSIKEDEVCDTPSFAVSK